MNFTLIAVGLVCLFLGLWMILMPSQFCKDDVKDTHQQGVFGSGIALLSAGVLVLLLSDSKRFNSMTGTLGFLGLGILVSGIIMFLMKDTFCKDGLKSKHEKAIQIASYVLMPVGSLMVIGAVYMTAKGPKRDKAMVDSILTKQQTRQGLQHAANKGSRSAAAALAVMKANGN